MTISYFLSYCKVPETVDDSNDPNEIRAGEQLAIQVLTSKKMARKGALRLQPTSRGKPPAKPYQNYSKLNAVKFKKCYECYEMFIPYGEDLPISHI